MVHLLPAAAIAALLLGAGAVQAATPRIDAKTDLALNCGASLMLSAEAADNQDDAAQYRMAGTDLLNYAGAILAAKGMTEKELNALGEKRTLDLAALFEKDGNPDFTPEQCRSLLLEVRGAASGSDSSTSPAPAAIEAPRITDKADRLLTCLAGFYVVADASTDEAEAKSLRTVRDKLSTLTDAQLRADGFTEDQIVDAGKSYGARIAKLIGDGKDLPYTWEECAALAM